ncbi:sugar kinase [Alkalicoccus urumqiensis]|uniref:Carbohydrate kinase PfkB domain-containing protein n=1 Tax=Alkalicoccus urumqiensis TaxID=1548213 RepID=A0A2P6MJN0_ALKUR|nr:sugar kinase [Alkalicoccus urumqiensis]PRO66489.1 hypothetical protein C6I21_03875 [Alkalicoccus urumqiensis]
MASIVTAGEVMMRLTPPEAGRIAAADSLKVHIGGAEANTACALSGLGHDVSLISRLPEHDIGTLAASSLRRHGVHLQHVSRGSGRMGLYFVEEGVSIRPSQVIYDRKPSAFTALTEEPVKREYVQGVEVLHLSGITPALSDSAADWSLELMQAAREEGVWISLDINYRSKLWSHTRALAWVEKALPYVDHCFAGWKDFEWLFGWEKAEGDLSSRLGAYYRRLEEEYGVRSAASTDRTIHDDGRHTLRGYVYENGRVTEGEGMTFQPLDRIGGGDAFAAGVLHGIQTHQSPEETAAFAESLSAMNHLVRGDNASFSEAEVQRFAAQLNQDISR